MLWIAAVKLSNLLSACFFYPGLFFLKLSCSWFSLEGIAIWSTLSSDSYSGKAGKAFSDNLPRQYFEHSIVNVYLRQEAEYCSYISGFFC